jgi:ParB family chromosome partitioning protein
MAFCIAFPDETSIPVLLLQESNNKEKILRYLLTDKIHSNHFSPMEKAYILKHCLKHMDIETASRKFLPLMKEKAQPHIITKFISLCDLEPELQQSIHFEQMTPKLGLELLALSKEDRKTLHTLFKQFEFGGGKQKRLLSLCQDLSRRKQTTITKMLAGKEYDDIIKHTEMNIPQKGASLLSLLYKQLYPQSNSAEEDFNKRVRRMNLPPSFSVEHSPAFEKDEVQLRVTFATLTHLEKQVTTIKKLQYPMA